MQKKVAAIIVHNEEILLTRKGEKHLSANKWRFPGGIVENGEKPAQHLKQKLQQELSINVPIKDMFESVKTTTFEILAYKLNGYIVNVTDRDSLKWVPIWELTSQNMPIEDKALVNIICAKVDPNLETKARVFAAQRIKIPYLNKQTDMWEVCFIRNEKEAIESFLTQQKAIEFYTQYVYDIITAFKRNGYMKIIQKLRS